MIGDTDLSISKAYDMLPADLAGSCEGRTPADNQTVRNVFVIGPDKKIKLQLAYPMTTGRNFDEVLRVIDSLQLTAKHKVSTPVNWKHGEDVIIAGSVSDDEAKKTYPERLEVAEALHPDRAATEVMSEYQAACRGRVPAAASRFNFGQQADELAEHHRGRAPHLVAEQIEVRVFDRDAFADPRPLPDPRRITQVLERHFENLLDFIRRRHEVGAPIGDAHDRVQGEAADEHVNRRELAEDSHACRIDARFLRRFAQRRLASVSPGSVAPPGRLICPGCRASPLARTVSATAAPVSCGYSSSSAAACRDSRGKLAGAPRLAEQVRRETHLRLDAGQRLAEALAKSSLDLA